MSGVLLAAMGIGFMSMVTFFTLHGIVASTNAEMLLAVMGGVVSGFIGLIILML